MLGKVPMSTYNGREVVIYRACHPVMAHLCRPLTVPLPIFNICTEVQNFKSKWFLTATSTGYTMPILRDRSHFNLSQLPSSKSSHTAMNGHAPHTTNTMQQIYSIHHISGSGNSADTSVDGNNQNIRNGREAMDGNNSAMSGDIESMPPPYTSPAFVLAALPIL